MLCSKVTNILINQRRLILNDPKLLKYSKKSNIQKLDNFVRTAYNYYSMIFFQLAFDFSRNA